MASSVVAPSGSRLARFGWDERDTRRPAPRRGGRDRGARRGTGVAVSVAVDGAPSWCGSADERPIAPFVASLFLVVRMLLVAMPGAPSSVLMPSSMARSPVRSVLLLPPVSV